MNRRAFLELLGIGVPLVVLTGCSAEESDAEGGRSGNGDAVGADGPAPSHGDGGPGDPDAWILPPIALVVGSGGTFDLATTLPTSWPPGGVFGVDPSGAPLPSGMTLSKEGVLAVGSAALGDVNGVVFSYET